MSVTYQVNYLVKFSEYVCDISGKLYHCIIPFSDNVCDIYQANYLSKVATEKKKRGKKRENNSVKSDNYDVASRPPNGNQLQRRYLCLFSYNGCDISQELYHFKQAFWKCGLCSNYFLLFPIGA